MKRESKVAVSIVQKNKKERLVDEVLRGRQESTHSLETLLP